MNQTFCYTVTMIAVVLTACSDPIDPVRDLTDCAEPGRVHSGQLSGGTWKRAASPHLLADSVHVNGSLTIEAGAVVCGMPGGILTVDTLVAIGTDDQPIMFGPAETNEFWGGIRVRGAATLRHAEIVAASSPVTDASESSATVILEDSRVLRSVGSILAQSLTLHRVDVDSACIGAPACVAVFARPYGITVLEDVRIRDSGGHGIATSYRCSIALSRVEVEGSVGTGLILPQDVRGGCGVSVQMPVRVTGGGSYPVVADGLHVVAQWLTPDRAELLKGNARDTIVVTNPENYSGSITVLAGLGLRLSRCTGHYAISTRRFGRVSIEPGATLIIEGGCTWYMDLEMNGSETDPATLIAPQTRIRSTLRLDTARIRNARVSGAVITADSSAMVFEDVELSQASLHLLAVGSHIEGLIAEGSAARLTSWPYETSDPAAVVLGPGTAMRRAIIRNATADAVRIRGDALIRDCTIAESGGHGVRVEAGLLSLRRCNIFSNTGTGVSNGAASMVDAVDNWWGDAAGPFGPAGDGVQGDVQFTPWLTAPAEFSAPAPGAGQQWR